jgi:hypothetical protein
MPMTKKHRVRLAFASRHGGSNGRGTDGGWVVCLSPAMKKQKSSRWPEAAMMDHPIGRQPTDRSPQLPRNRATMKFILAACAVLLTGALNAQAATLPNNRHMPPPTRTTKTGKGSLLLTYSPFFDTIIFSKNVSTVTSPSTGVFCVVPIKAIPSGSLPSVTVEWGFSAGNALLAYLEQQASDCGAGQVEVRTFDFNSGGAPVASVNVAFNVFVP